MRYERTEDIVRLVMMMLTRTSGVSLYDIQDDFGVSRRTAERMRDAVVRLYPHAEVFDGHDRIRRWKIGNSSVNLASFSSEEMAEMESIKNRLHSEGSSEKSEIIGGVIIKIKSLNKTDNTKIENDAEALLEAEGCAIRQYPRTSIKANIFDVIRESFKSFKKIHIEYKPKDKDRSEFVIHPYGLLYGEKYYLIAYSEPRQALRMYDLSRIEKISIVDEYFDKDENFNLKDYANNSFGIYQEKAMNVSLLFDKAVAEEVKNYHFHPSQAIKEFPNGSVSVEFTAGGSKAICWHLFKWGGAVQIIKPVKLKTIYKDLVQEVSQSLSS